MVDFLPLNGISYLELYVGNAQQACHYYKTALGFQPYAYAGPETGSQDRKSYVLKQGDIKLMLTSPLEPTSEIAAHIHMHADGIKIIALEVDDAHAAFNESVKRGARPHRFPFEHTDEHGKFAMSGIHVYGDTLHMFIERKNYDHFFLPGYVPLDNSFQPAPTGLESIDHVMGNVGWSERDVWCEFYEEIMGFSPTEAFDDRDISGRYSVLMSKNTPHGSIRFPITEPREGKHKTRVEKFLKHYKGPGVQHVALRTHDIIRTVQELYDRGVSFQQIKDHPLQIEINRLAGSVPEIRQLKELGILVDKDPESYLLQIFTQPINDRPTFCYEIIQRLSPEEMQSSPFSPLFKLIDQDKEEAHS